MEFVDVINSDENFDIFFYLLGKVFLFVKKKNNEKVIKDFIILF